jgi:hypothetical protein
MRKPQRFVTLARATKAGPRSYQTWRQEVEPPYRRAEPCRVVRLVGRWALVAGRWQETGFDEDQALHAITNWSAPWKEFAGAQDATKAPREEP